MIDGLKPYPEYKKSGLLWLSKIPAHWQVVRNGSLFAQRNQTGFAHLPILEVSLKTGIRVRDFENSCASRSWPTWQSTNARLRVTLPTT